MTKAKPTNTTTNTATPVPTLDGKRLELDDLNIGQASEQAVPSGRLRSFLRSVSLFMAGMYTGVKCGGTPHPHHTYNNDKRQAKERDL